MEEPVAPSPPSSPSASASAAAADDGSVGSGSPPESPLPPDPEQQLQSRPLLLRRLSSRVVAPPPPEPPSPAPEPPPASPSSPSPSPSPSPPQPAKPVKRVRFADQQPRPLICSPTWWRGCLRVLLSPTARRARLQAARYRLESVLRGRAHFVGIVLVTVYVLLGDQLRLAALPPSADPPFRALNTLAFLLLLLEMLAAGWVYEDYFLHLGPKPPRTAAASDEAPLLALWRRLHAPSFFFWLDALGVVLLPFDPTYISFISHPGNPSLLATNASQLSDKAVRVVRALRATSFLRLLKYGGGFPSLDCAACCAACCCLDGGYGPDEGEEEEEEEEEDDDDGHAAEYVGGGVVMSERPRRRGSKTSRRGAGKGSGPMEGPGAEEEDRLATAVTASLHRKVVVGGLLLLTLAPFLDYAAEDTTWAFLFAALGGVAAEGGAAALAGFAALLGNVTDLGVGRLEVNGVTYLDRPRGASCRPDEYVTFETPAPGAAAAAAADGGAASLRARTVVDASALSRLWAWESILLTLAALALFWGLAVSLRGDLDRLVFAPLDQMVRLVRRIARNPLAPIREADDEAEAAGAGADGGRNDGGGGSGAGALASTGASGGRRGLGGAQGLETALLLQTIGKIGALMRIGLGAAGADIISRNLVLDAAPRPEGLDLRMAGKLVSAVFVFCDVRNFTDATECLQEEVMVFVNKVAAILHELTVCCGGAPNKNVGDAFLLIWKVAVHEENDEEEDEEEGEHEGEKAGRAAAADPEARTRKALAEGPQARQAAGRALYCVLKFGVELARLHAYVCRFSSAASQRLYARLPGYRVGVGFGLHVGWAVEGPIGSAQKIDVSYVSPHVTAAEYLQDLTKEYGCTVLLSEAFYHALPPVAQYNCRQVDCVRRAAAASSGGGFLAEPMSLYTYDCDPEHMQPPPSSSSYGATAAGGRRSPPPPSPSVGLPSRAAGAAGAAGTGVGRQSIDPLQSITVRPYSDTVWEADPDLQHIATKLHPNFRATWNYAMSSYLAGEWASARRGFETTLELSQGRDGPSKRLLAVLEQHGHRAPPGWAGFRELEG